MEKEPQPLPYTRFSYRQFFSDPAVVCMTNEEVGAYLRLLHAAWESSPPGHLPDDDAYLAAVSCMATAWPDHRAAIAKAFKLEDGKWIQARVVREYEVARGYSMARHAIAVAGATVRWQKHPSRMREHCSYGEGRGESKRESKSTPLVIAGALTVSRAASTENGKSQSAEWDQALDLLWPDFPRKVGKPAALRAWRGIRPQTQEQFDAIDAGLARWCDYWRTKDREKICHPATWLNQRRWEDEP